MRRMFKPFGVCYVLAVLFALILAADVYAGTATIGGNIWKGAKLPDGSPQYSGNSPVTGAKVMVQNQSGGGIAAYGDVSGNSWTATVPAPGDYVVMFSASGYDATSREFAVAPGDNLAKDAYLPPLPFPKSNLLVYAFKDNYVNGEDDFPTDPALKGVTFTVWDEDDNLVKSGVSGLSPTLPQGAGPDAAGLFYFTGLEPGEYKVCADPSTVPKYNTGLGAEWYHTTTEEGTRCWEALLYPGDPGTENGAYLVWFGFVPKLGALPAGQATGSISGTLKDADGPWDPAEPFNPTNPFVTPNYYVPNGFLVLYSAQQGEPVATTEADHVTGAFKFENVPPGRYKIYAADLPLRYIWQEANTNVAPGEAVSLEILVPRFYARVHGYVVDSSTGNALAGVKVRLRLKDGSIWKEQTTDPYGWYNFDTLEEVEVLGTVEVEPLQGYRGTIDPVSGYSLATRTIQWFTFNYRADLEIEPVPAEEGVVGGFVYNDNLVRGSWAPDGKYDPYEERTVHGAKVELYDSAGSLLAETRTGATNKGALKSQGWIEPYTWPPDEFGGVFMGPVPGYYEFRGLPPGDYIVRVTPPSWFYPSPAGSEERAVRVQGRDFISLDFGVNTLAPLAGEIEGGVFDDVNIDENPQSLLFEEKAGIAGVPVGVYDHLGYLLGVGYMGNPLCYSGSTACPPGEEPVQKPEMERRFAPGVHVYLGNDPSQPGYNKNFEPLALPYEFGQGKYKFEADWSLLPFSFAGGANQFTQNEVPQDAPQIDNATRLAALNQAGVMLAYNGTGGVLPQGITVPDPSTQGTPVVVRVFGRNFGDRQAHSTVTLSGVRLQVNGWSDGQIDVVIPAKAVSGPLTVATSTGISNSLNVEILYGSTQASYMAARSVFVDSGYSGASDGSPQRPWRSIREALSHLPSYYPRYVFVAPGTYSERIRIRSSNIRIIGAGPRETVLSGFGPLSTIARGANGSGPVITIGRNLKDILISGLAITGGSNRDGVGGAVFGDQGNSNLDINNCIITHNGGYYGGGIWLNNSNHNVNIWSNVIAYNGSSGGYGGGISVNDEPVNRVRGIEAEPEHTVDDNLNAIPPGTYNIFNNLVHHNYSPDYGGGFALYEIKDQLNVYGNLFIENRADDHGGGGFFEDAGPIVLKENVFLRNLCADDGGAISFEDQYMRARVYNNLFVENIADDRGENTARGGALAFDDTFHVDVYNNTFSGNVVAGTNMPAGAAIDSERNGHEYLNLSPGYSDPRIYNNILWGNLRLDYDKPKRDTEMLSYRNGENPRWSSDELHVDNPALQGEWDSYKNSESFTHVENNIITGGYSGGTGNFAADPLFFDPLGLDWHLYAGSPAIGKAPSISASSEDLERFARTADQAGKVDLGAYEFHNPADDAVRIPADILGAVTVPRPW